MENLDQLANQAAALDSEIDKAAAPETGTGVAVVTGEVLPPLRNEIADMISTLAMAGSFVLPTVPKHFNQQANLAIADAVITLAERYKYDIRASMLGENSVIIVWVGLVFAVGTPLAGCWNDVKAIKAAQRKAANSEKEVHQTPARDEETPAHNSVVTGAD